MRTKRAFLYTAAVTLSLISLAGQKANAGQLYNSWDYGIDSFSDGSGGAVFDIKGMAVKQVR
ncbi:hypothetical protein [Nostoc sp.]|uniref:hypothetical protein n=1 Tax=Nostoc sp. TaxID=1180 RepID=UPI002FF84C63